MHWSHFPWSQISAPAILAFTIWLILTGRLVPRSVLRDAKEQAEKWEAAFLTSQDNSSRLVAMVEDLTEAEKTNKTLLREIANRRDSHRPARDRTT